MKYGSVLRKKRQGVRKKERCQRKMHGSWETKKKRLGARKRDGARKKTKNGWSKKRTFYLEKRGRILEKKEVRVLGKKKRMQGNIEEDNK